MLLQKMQVKNFRCFEQAEWEFASQVNVLVGDNGAGKTAILEAIAFGVGALTGPLGEIYPRRPAGGKGIQISAAELNARLVVYEKGGVPTRESQFPVEVHISGEVDSKTVKWGRVYDGNKNGHNLKEANAIKEIGTRMRSAIEEGQNVILPLIAYYGCRRLCPLESRFVRELSFSGPGSQLLGYDDCLDATINQRNFLEWFRRLEFAAMQRSEPFGVLEGVRRAITECTDDVTQIRFDSLENELLLKFKDGRELPFRMLSDGYRNIVSLIADIAYRAAILNPQFEAGAPQQTPGVVLIDEIDLHLHPTWQRVIIGKMIAIFPCVQFFLTTHAPLIIQSLEVSSQAKLINLDPGLSTEFRHKSPEEIYEDNQGIEHIERSHRFRMMVDAASEYYRTLDQAKEASPKHLEQLKRRLDELMLPFSDEPAYVAFLEMHREANPVLARAFDAAR